jgi:hypothetical protein
MGEHNGDGLMDQECRCIVLTCNDFQGDDPLTVKATMAAAKAVKKTFDVSLKAAKKQIGRPLTKEENDRMLNMTMTVKVMKVRIDR